MSWSYLIEGSAVVGASQLAQAYEISHADRLSRFILWDLFGICRVFVGSLEFGNGPLWGGVSFDSCVALRCSLLAFMKATCSRLVQYDIEGDILVCVGAQLWLSPWAANLGASQCDATAPWCPKHGC